MKPTSCISMSLHVLADVRDAHPGHCMLQLAALGYTPLAGGGAAASAGLLPPTSAQVHRLHSWRTVCSSRPERKCLTCHKLCWLTTLSLFAWRSPRCCRQLQGC